MLDEATEVWQNTARGTVILWRHDGVDRFRERVTGGKRIEVTRQERRRMEAQVSAAQYNPFRNGTFALLEAGADPDPSLLDNPNALTEADIAELWGKGLPAFEKAIAAITNPVTAERVVEVGASHEKANPKKTAVAEARLAELRPPVNEVTHIDAPGGAGPGDPQPLPDMSRPQGVPETLV